MYPFAETFVVESEDDTKIELLNLPADSIVEGCRVEILVPVTGGTSPLVSIGASTDVDGIIEEAAADGAAGTVYGDAVAEYGDDIKVATGATSGYTLVPVMYVAATSVYLVLDQAVTTQGTFKVSIWGKVFSDIS